MLALACKVHKCPVCTEKMPLASTASEYEEPVNQLPVITTSTAPVPPVQLGQSINATVRFSDPDANDTHPATCVWGDGVSDDYYFMVSAIDGTPDKFRIKIWDKITGEVIYDNQLGALDTTDPTTAIQGGSIVIHKPK